MNNNDKRIVKGIETKEGIIQSAVTLFSKNGYDGTSIKDITDAAGVPKSLFYHYFSSKNALLSSIVEQYELRVSEEEKESIIQRSTNAGFTEIATRIFLKLQEQPDILKLIVLEALKNNSIMKALIEKTDKLGNDFDSIIPESVKKEIKEERMLVFRFYYRFIPMILFSLSKDFVSNYYGLSQERLENCFIELLKFNPFMFSEEE